MGDNMSATGTMVVLEKSEESVRSREVPKKISLIPVQGTEMDRSVPSVKSAQPQHAVNRSSLPTLLTSSSMGRCRNETHIFETKHNPNLAQDSIWTGWWIASSL